MTLHHLQHVYNQIRHFCFTTEMSYTCNCRNAQYHSVITVNYIRIRIRIRKVYFGTRKRSDLIISINIKMELAHTIYEKQDCQVQWHLI